MMWKGGLPLAKATRGWRRSQVEERGRETEAGILLARRPFPHGCGSVSSCSLLIRRFIWSDRASNRWPSFRPSREACEIANRPGHANVADGRSVGREANCGQYCR